MSRAATPKYRPGQELITKQGFSLEEFNNLDKPVVMERGFLTDPEAYASATIITNYSARTKQYVLCTAALLDPSLPKERWNQQEIGSFILQNGESSHWVTDPTRYFLRLSYKRHSDTSYNPIAGDATEVFVLRDRVFTINNMSDIRYPTLKSKIAELGGWCKIDNKTDYKILIEVCAQRVAYNLTAEQIAAERKSRQPDFAPIPIISHEVQERQVVEFKAPSQDYTVYALNPSVTSSSSSQVRVRLSSVRDYVQEDSIGTSNSCVIVDTFDANDTNITMMTNLQFGEIKPVDPRMAVNR